MISQCLLENMGNISGYFLGSRVLKSWCSKSNWVQMLRKNKDKSSKAGKLRRKVQKCKKKLCLPALAQHSLRICVLFSSSSDDGSWGLGSWVSKTSFQYFSCSRAAQDSPPQIPGPWCQGRYGR